MECVSETNNSAAGAIGGSKSDEIGTSSTRSSQNNAEGLAVVRVLAAVLDRLVSANSGLASVEPGPVTKFHALKAPSISVLNYLERIHKYASCSAECFVLALIYIDRMIQRNNFLLTELNVHRVVITGVLLAAKFFDDAYYNNAYYAKVGGVLVAEMNSLEVEFLFRINFSLHVTPDVYSKYHAELLMHAVGTPAAATLSAALSNTNNQGAAFEDNIQPPATTWKPPPAPSTNVQHTAPVVQQSVNITPSPRSSVKACPVTRRQTWTPHDHHSKDVIGMQPVVSSQYHVPTNCEQSFTNHPIVYQSHPVYFDPATDQPQTNYYDPVIDQKSNNNVLVDNYVTNNIFPSSDNKMLIHNHHIHHLNSNPALINLVINNSQHQASYHPTSTQHHQSPIIIDSRRHSIGSANATLSHTTSSCMVPGPYR